MADVAQMAEQALLTWRTRVKVRPLPCCSMLSSYVTKNSNGGLTCFVHRCWTVKLFDNWVCRFFLSVKIATSILALLWKPDTEKSRFQSFLVFGHLEFGFQVYFITVLLWIKMCIVGLGCFQIGMQFLSTFEMHTMQSYS